MKREQKNQVMESLALVMQIGVSMIVSIFLGTFLGLWLGKRLDADWIAIAGFAVGALAGGESVYRIVKKYLVKNDKRI